MTFCNEMQKFRIILNNRGIEWKDSSLEECPLAFMERTIFKYNNQRWSAIHGTGSYGGPNFNNDNVDPGLLEIWNWDNGSDPIGYLTAEKAAQIIFKK